MTLRIAPLAEALGAEVAGPDWARPLDAGTLAELNRAYHEFQLLCQRSEP